MFSLWRIRPVAERIPKLKTFYSKQYILMIFLTISLSLGPATLIRGQETAESAIKDLEALKSLKRDLDDAIKLMEKSAKTQKSMKPEIKSFFDTSLKDIKLLPPRERDHRKGSDLVLIALVSSNLAFNGSWTEAYGLVGVSMLNVSDNDSIAYESMFKRIIGSKLSTTMLMSGNVLLVEDHFKDSFSFPATNSWITKRESIFYVLSGQINNRFIFNNEGNWGRNYNPDPKRKYRKKKIEVLKSGLNLLKQFRSEGFNDLTLKDSLGVFYAIVERDYGTLNEISLVDRRWIVPIQKYRDALEATLNILKKDPKDHSAEFLEELRVQMQIRDLATDDRVLLPKDVQSHKAFLKIVEKDLENIELKSNQ